MIVACNGKYLHNAVKGIDYGDIKSSSAEIHYHICAVPEAVACLIGKCCGGRLIYQSFRINARKLCGKLGSSSAVIVKICGHADDSLGHRLAQIGFRIFLYPAQHKGGQLLGREAPSAESDSLAQTHYPLELSRCCVWVRYEPLFCHPAHKYLAIVVNADHRGKIVISQTVFYDLSLFVSVAYGKAVCSSQINSYDSHNYPHKTSFYDYNTIVTLMSIICRNFN